MIVSVLCFAIYQGMSVEEKSPMRHRDRSLPSQDKFENQSRMRTNATYKLKSFVTPMIKKKRARRKNKEGKTNCSFVFLAFVGVLWFSSIYLARG